MGWNYFLNNKMNGQLVRTRLHYKNDLLSYENDGLLNMRGILTEKIIIAYTWYNSQFLQVD